jgi:PIN domain nuclease of toxin-antitoxin system
MRLLLDTHALLWWQADDSRLGPSASALKMRVDIGAIGRAMIRDGFDTLPIQLAHLATLATLPQHHRDPFDHLLIAQAIAEDVVFVSDDRNVPHYEVRLQSCRDA